MGYVNLGLDVSNTLSSYGAYHFVCVTDSVGHPGRQAGWAYMRTWDLTFAEVGETRD